MPELAEVEYYRRVWDAGAGRKVLRAHVHAAKRVFRGADAERLSRALSGAVLKGSEAHGKQMLFRFSGEIWLGVHLGMTGELRVAPPDYAPAKHDHLVLFQEKGALVFADPRQFGRILFHQGKDAPAWWSDLPPAIGSDEFTLERMKAFVRRRGKAPVKAVLLMQEAFPGIGNWMADEILWRARLNPAAKGIELTEKEMLLLWKETRRVAKEAIRHVSPAFGDPPKNWLFHARWKPGGRCPRDGETLRRSTIGGRTTAWCERCQPAPGRKHRAGKKTIA